MIMLDDKVTFWVHTGTNTNKRGAAESIKVWKQSADTLTDWTKRACGPVGQTKLGQAVRGPARDPVRRTERGTR